MKLQKIKRRKNVVVQYFKLLYLRSIWILIIINNGYSILIFSMRFYSIIELLFKYPKKVK